MSSLRKYLLAGIVALAPLLVTVALINWLVEMSDRAIALLPEVEIVFSESIARQTATSQSLRIAAQGTAVGGRITFACHAPLQDILTRAFAPVDGVTIVCHDDEVPATDWHAPLLALPHLFGTELDTIPSPEPTIQLRDAGRCTLPAHPMGDEEGDGKLKVGLVWSGNPVQRNSRCGFVHGRQVSVRVSMSRVRSSTSALRAARRAR